MSILVAGVRINDKQRIYDSLQKIYGLGKSKIKQIICILGLTENICLKDFTFIQKLKLNKMIVHYMHGPKAKRFKSERIKFLNENNCYRGIRHNYFLSVRGQRTRTNAKTQRNKKNKKNKKKIITKKKNVK